MPEQTGIPKSAQPTEPTVVQYTEVKEGMGTVQYQEVPMDVYRHFNIDIGSVDTKEVEKLKAISGWAFKDVDSIGDGMQKIRQLQMKLGSPHLRDKSWDKVFNWVSIQKHINDLEKRQEALWL